MTTAVRPTIAASGPRAAAAKTFAGPTTAVPQTFVAAPAGRHTATATGRDYLIPSAGPDTDATFAGLRPGGGLSIGLCRPGVVVERLIRPWSRGGAG